ncbi:MAG: polysaccharide biosynthesis protein [Clostridiales bacterium]|nr:polysaccharide biosynthesis protein [Clostridiales bacterium]
MKKNNLMSGALILSIGGVLAKVFSAIYRIGLTRILGGEGIGIYQLVFPFYSLCVVLATAGLPMAISKVISKNRGKEKSVVKKCMIFTSIISLIITFILLTCSHGLAGLQGNKDIAICYVILAPTIILVSATSVLRGYFQGRHDFTPSAVSNISEQFVKLVVGLVLSLALLGVSVMASIVGAMISIVISEVISIFVLLVYFKKEPKSDAQAKVSIKELMKDIAPITLTNIILPISSFIDSVLVVNLLSVNFSNQLSVFLYGLESGAVSSLVSLPTIFSFAIASVILPNLAKSEHKFNKNEKISISIKIILIIAVPTVLCFLLVPDRVIRLLYGSRLNGFNIAGTAIASQLLAISSLGVVFLSINQIYSSSLQAIDERYVTIRNITIGVILKFVIELIFLPSKLLNIYALAVANTVCYVTTMVLNHMEIRENFSLNISHVFVGKLLISNSVMLIVLLSVLSISDTWSNTLLALICGVVFYFFSLFYFKIFDRKEKAMLKYKV